MIKYYHCMILFLFLISGCGLEPNSSQNPNLKVLTPEVGCPNEANLIRGKSSKKTGPNPGKENWLKIQAFGQPTPEALEIAFGPKINNIDYSGKILFEDDNRIDDIHKKKIPQFKGKYVLWRMPHDGSCWVSAAITLMFFQMIEEEPQEFDAIVEKMRALADPKRDLASFFSIFETVKQHRDYRLTLELRNHQKAYDTLDAGMRHLAAQAKRKNKTVTESSPEKIETPKSWGYLSDFKQLFLELGLRYYTLDIGFNIKNEPVTPSIYGFEIESPPKMMVIHSSLAFMDVLVDKDLSYQINHQRK